MEVCPLVTQQKIITVRDGCCWAVEQCGCSPRQFTIPGPAGPNKNTYSIIRQKTNTGLEERNKKKHFSMSVVCALLHDRVTLFKCVSVSSFCPRFPLIIWHDRKLPPSVNLWGKPGSLEHILWFHSHLEIKSLILVFSQRQRCSLSTVDYNVTGIICIYYFLHYFYCIIRLQTYTIAPKMSTYLIVSEPGGTWTTVLQIES